MMPTWTPPPASPPMRSPSWRQRSPGRNWTVRTPGLPGSRFPGPISGNPAAGNLAQQRRYVPDARAGRHGPAVDKPHLPGLDRFHYLDGRHVRRKRRPAKAGYQSDSHSLLHQSDMRGEIGVVDPEVRDPPQVGENPQEGLIADGPVGCADP